MRARGAFWICIALLGAVAVPVPRAAASGTPLTVVALIDSGINPYHSTFRDTSPTAKLHPSRYIAGYPKDAKTLQLSLGLPIAESLKRDAKVWRSVKPETLYWIPGTKIIGAISFGPGGVRCPAVTELPIVSTLITDSACSERPILDDYGHGTMTASRAAGRSHSLAPSARILAIEGLSPMSVRFAADAGWVDVQSNSWGSLVPHPVTSAIPEPSIADIAPAFEYASKRTVTIAASGNGTAFALGAAPSLTYLSATLPPGVLIVGGHDNGRITFWSSSPPHVVADAYGGWRAPHDSTAKSKAHPMACCTSAAAPYAAGGVAALIQDARVALGDTTPGIHHGVVASGRRGRFATGPLADGRLTMRELRDVFLRTAEARPQAGRDDGIVHWMGQPRSPDYVENGPGANPFCPACTTMPVEWSSVPAAADAYPLIGYGAINERSVASAVSVLFGHAPMPSRPSEDEHYRQDFALRRALFPAL